MEETVIRMAAPTLAGIKTGSLFPYYYESREELGKEMGRLNRLLIPRGLRLVLLRLTERSALLYLYGRRSWKRISRIARQASFSAVRAIPAQTAEPAFGIS